MTTFKDLGIPFPLFDANTDEAEGYLRLDECSVCGKSNHYFRLGIGCALLIKCPVCKTENGLDVYDKSDYPCRNCSFISFLLQIISVNPVMDDVREYIIHLVED